jgi:hypothetical protein
MNATLLDFCNDAATLQPNPAREESVPLGPVPIRNFALVRQLIEKAFEKNPGRTALVLTSNGSPEKKATEYFLRRVIT